MIGYCIKSSSDYVCIMFIRESTSPRMSTILCRSSCCAPLRGRRMIMHARVPAAVIDSLTCFSFVWLKKQLEINHLIGYQPYSVCTCCAFLWFFLDPSADERGIKYG